MQSDHAARSLTFASLRFGRLQSEFAADKAAYDAKAEEVKRTDDLLSALTTGLSSGDGEKGYMEQLQGTRPRAVRYFPSVSGAVH